MIVAHDASAPPPNHDVKLQRTIAFLAQQPHVCDWVIESRPLFEDGELEAEELKVRFDNDEEGEEEWNPNEEGNTMASLEDEMDENDDRSGGGDDDDGPVEAAEEEKGEGGSRKVRARVAFAEDVGKENEDDESPPRSASKEKQAPPRLEISAYLFSSTGEPKQGIVYSGETWPSSKEILTTCERVLRYRTSILLDKFMWVRRGREGGG